MATVTSVENKGAKKGTYYASAKGVKKAAPSKTDEKGAFEAIIEGFHFSEKGEYAEAIKCYSKAIKLNPKMAKAYAMRGVMFLKCELYYVAIKDFTKAIELRSDDVRDEAFLAQDYNARGLAYFNSNKYSLALKDFDSAIKYNPQFADAYRNRADVEGKMGDKEAQERDIAKYNELK